MKIALYASNHGFGHASRIAALAQSFIEYGCYVYICSDRPAFLFQDLPDGHWEYRESKLDRGVVHKENLVTDLEKTKAALMELFSQREELVAAEILFLREQGVDLVVSDVPFLIVEACLYTEVPIFGVSNFDWYFIYQELFGNDEDIIPILSVIHSLYRRMNRSFLLDLGAPYSVPGFKNPIDGGLVARTKSEYVSPYDKYGIKEGTQILLLMFGGEGAIEIPIEAICKAWDGVVISPYRGYKASNLLHVEQDDDFISLMQHSDIVICKPGYSTFAEVLSMGKSMIYIPRRNYPEERVLITGVKDYPGAKRVDCFPEEVGEIRKLFTEVRQGDFKKNKANGVLAGKIINEFVKVKYPQDRIVSVCDLGSNNMNYILYNKSKDKVIHRYWCTTGLGLDFRDGRLSEESITQALQAMSSILKIDSAIASEKKLIATGISRMAQNSGELLDEIHVRWSFKGKVINAKTEMKYAWLAAQPLMLHNTVNIILDIGGVSTEIVWGSPNGKYCGESMPFGLINLYLNENKGVSVEQVVLKELNRLPLYENIQLIVVGLTATMLFRYIRKAGIKDSLGSNGEKLEYNELSRLITDIFQDKVMEYQSMAHSPREIVSMGIAARVIQLVLDRYRSSYFVVCNDGISVGYAKWMK
ncbi:MAG: glycosyltransferase [Candidatus Cloacimonetes bacterium]|nr:glycosyltransferase [Candidatus Cloacimonadota bacterium]MDD4560226.1 glycosyltransferase [Candidatus Cloacimonadota bacterium]